MQKISTKNTLFNKNNVFQPVDKLAYSLFLLGDLCKI